MKIITQLVILTMLLLLVNADDDHCTKLIKDFNTNKCTTSMITIDSCCDLKNLPVSGIFKLSKGSFDNSVDAYCDMTTDGGGWIVIQRNKKISLIDFNKNWIDYEKGFGDLNKEFWYGLSAMHCLTQRGQWEMRVDYQHYNKTWSYLHYNQFSVGSASEKYPLTVGGFTGVGTDEFSRHPLNGMKFSTPDNDNDKNNGNCAVDHKSGWWHNHCYRININSQPPQVHSLVLFSEMKIRPKDCITQ